MFCTGAQYCNYRIFLPFTCEIVPYCRHDSLDALSQCKQSQDHKSWLLPTIDRWLITAQFVINTFRIMPIKWSASCVCLHTVSNAYQLLRMIICIYENIPTTGIAETVQEEFSHLTTSMMIRSLLQQSIILIIFRHWTVLILFSIFFKWMISTTIHPYVK